MNRYFTKSPEISRFFDENVIFGENSEKIHFEGCSACTCAQFLMAGGTKLQFSCGQSCKKSLQTLSIVSSGGVSPANYNCQFRSHVIKIENK